MAEPARYFFDTYALLERQRGKASYAPYAAVPVVTHQANLQEFVAAATRELSESRVREEVRLMNPNLIEADLDDVFAAAAVRAQHPRRHLSHADALGYALARRHGLRFLTGDKAFKGLDNVEHVP